MKYRFTLLVICIPVCVEFVPTCSAHAEDGPEQTSWTGFFIGPNAGYARGTIRTSNNFTETTGPLFGLPAGAITRERYSGPDRLGHGNGWLYGGQIGFNYQLRQFVFGVEADFQKSDIEASDFFLGSDAGPSYYPSQKTDLMGTLRGRIGYAFGPILPYVTGGLAYSHNLNRLTTQGGTPDIPVGSIYSANVGYDAFGFAVGGGIEYALGAHWSVKAEYLLVRFEPKDVVFHMPTTDDSIAGGTNRTEFEIVRSGFNYRF